MSKVINQFRVEKYTVLILDKMPESAYCSFLIDGKIYEPVPIYDARNCVAITSEGSFIGKSVEFLTKTA